MLAFCMTRRLIHGEHDIEFIVFVQIFLRWLLRVAALCVSRSWFLF